ncbi:MAG: hypothetical protein IPL73_13285 [Candidatus Obscuribacter sp.]|nr:hypothetical protein [Candidatus Obscuribacter sp.]
MTGIALLFCAVKLSIDGGFINKNQQMVAPINKILTDIGANKVNFTDMKPTAGSSKRHCKVWQSNQYDLKKIKDQAQAKS